MNLRLQFRRYRLPFRVPVRTAHGLWSEREGILIRVEDDAGSVGWGEVAPVAGFGTETVDEAEAACRSLRGIVEETRLRAPPGMPCLGAALGAARRELAGTAVTGKPGAAGAGPIPVSALLPAGSAALKDVRLKADAEFRTFKWKVGLAAMDDELGLLDDLCSALPPGGSLRLDANGAWERRGAERWLERCAERPVEFVEQPVPRGADDLLRGLAGDYPTPLALDESLSGGRDIARWLAERWPGLYIVKPSLLEEADRTLANLAAARAPVVFSSGLETAVGARSALRTALEWPGERRALGLGVWPLFEDSIFDGPHARPFFGSEDVERIKPEIPWNALS